MVRKLRTKVFELCNWKYANLTELARAMGISASQIYRVRQGKRAINEKFIIEAIRAFPNHKLDELFYLEPRSPSGNIDKVTVDIRHEYIVQKYTS